MEFKYYVMNEDHNTHKVQPFNIFNNWVLNDAVEKEIKKYLRSPGKYKHETYNEEIKYGFDGLCEEINRLIMWQEWSRCEYEIAVGSIFTTEIKDVLLEVERGKIAKENLYDELLKIHRRNHEFTKIDCYSQCEPNIPAITRECIYQYKQYLKNNKQ